MQNTRYVAVAGRGTVGFYKNPTDAWEKLFLGRVSGTCSSFYLCSAGPAAAQPCLLSWTCFLTAGARLPGNFSWCKTFCIPPAGLLRKTSPGLTWRTQQCSAGVPALHPELL